MKVDLYIWLILLDYTSVFRVILLFPLYDSEEKIFYVIKCGEKGKDSLF